MQDKIFTDRCQSVASTHNAIIISNDFKTLSCVFKPSNEQTFMAYFNCGFWGCKNKIQEVTNITQKEIRKEAEIRWEN